MKIVYYCRMKEQLHTSQTVHLNFLRYFQVIREFNSEVSNVKSLTKSFISSNQDFITQSLNVVLYFNLFDQVFQLFCINILSRLLLLHQPSIRASTRLLGLYNPILVGQKLTNGFCVLLPIRRYDQTAGWCGLIPVNIIVISNQSCKFVLHWYNPLQWGYWSHHPEAFFPVLLYSLKKVKSLWECLKNRFSKCVLVKLPATKHLKGQDHSWSIDEILIKYEAVSANAVK